jgi:hypothetical protein
VGDRRLQLGDDFILLKADPAMPPCKIGYFNRLGWLGYWLGDQLFVKRSSLQPGERYPDDGCNAEVYCSDRFIEPETLGPLTSLAPGETVVHEEVWEVHHLGLDQNLITSSVLRRIRSAQDPRPEEIPRETALGLPIRSRASFI